MRERSWPAALPFADGGRVGPTAPYLVGSGVLPSYVGPSNTGERILAEARSWLGTPVRWEASVKGVGADCRGLLAGAARECGRPEALEIEARLVGYSRRIDEQALVRGLNRLFDPVADCEEARPGDVLAFRINRKIQHLGIANGQRGMIHAYMSDPAQVVEVPLGTFWAARLAGIWRWRDGD